MNLWQIIGNTTRYQSFVYVGKIRKNGLRLSLRGNPKVLKIGREEF